MIAENVAAHLLYRYLSSTAFTATSVIKNKKLEITNIIIIIIIIIR